MTGIFLALAFLSALNPKLLPVDLLLIDNTRSRRMCLCFLVGWLGIALTVGLLDVFARRADTISTQGSLCGRPGALYITALHGALPPWPHRGRGLRCGVAGGGEGDAGSSQARAGCPAIPAGPGTEHGRRQTGSPGRGSSGRDGTGRRPGPR
jgi:hypothetical protein